MALAEFMKSLDGLVAAAEQAFDSAEENDKLEAARVEFLGAKQGKLKAVQKQMGSIEKTDRPAAGKRFNEVKQQIEGAFQAATQRLESGAAEQDASERGASEQGGAGKSGRRGREVFDPTLPGETLRIGRLHPITRTIEELKDIMGRLGFSVVLGPEIEDEWHNFKALNIPDDHPARDPLENFYLAAEAAGSAAATSAAATSAAATSDSTSSAAPSDTDAPLLLRSQTSTVQIRVMEKTPPPVRIISLGRVYRPDTADRTHYPMFHQMEGLLIDKHVTMADLKSVLRLFATSYLGDDVHIRFRPSFFPFTEPSVEADFSWHDGWVEFGGAGMVDPHVLEAVGYDPEEVTGFAFGLGVERLCMRRHGITDIRELYKNDIRFLHQF